AADPVREIMILRGGDRRRQMAEAEFLQTRQKAFLLLTAKYPEHEFSGVSAPAPRHHRQNEAGEIGVIEIGDTAPSQPLRLLRVAVAGHLGDRPPQLLFPQVPAAFVE